MSISPGSAARGSKDLPFLKYNAPEIHEYTELFLQNLILQNFYRSFFCYNPYLLQCSALKCIYFHIPVHFNISIMAIFGAL